MREFTQKLPYKETRLLALMQRRFSHLASDYEERINCFSNSPNSPYLRLRWNERKNSFRYNSDLPAILYISKSLSRFGKMLPYVVPVGQKRSYFAAHGMRPAYFFNLNRICCLELWGQRAADVFSPTSRPFLEGDEITRYYDTNRGNPLQFSSLNFVLGWGAPDVPAMPEVRKIVADYFNYAFWSFPKPGFSSNAHIFYSHDDVHSIIKVAKGIYRVRGIGKKRSERLAPDHYRYLRRADLEIVSKKTCPVISPIISDDIAQEISDGYTDCKNVLINGLIYDYSDKVHPSGGLKLLSVISEFLPTNSELIKTLAGISASETFRHNESSCGLIGSFRDLKKDVCRRYAPYGRLAFTSTSMSDALGRGLDSIIEDLFPIIIQHEDDIYYIHPMIVCGLLELELKEVLRTKDKLAFVNFVKVLSNLQNSGDACPISHETEFFRSYRIRYTDLFQTAGLVLRGLMLFKAIDKYFEHSLKRQGEEGFFSFPKRMDEDYAENRTATSRYRTN